MENQQQIIGEVRELCRQYLNEVPSKRRTWPKSIKERVLQLLQLELSCEQICKATGIPAPTVYSWKSQTSGKLAGFLPLQVIEKAPIHAIPPRRRLRSRRAASTIIVIAPNGLRVEGLDIQSMLRLMRELGTGAAL